MNVPIRLRLRPRPRTSLRPRATLAAAATASALGAGLLLAPAIVHAQDGTGSTATRQDRSETRRTQPDQDRDRDRARNREQATMLQDMLERMDGTWRVSLAIAPDAIGAWSPATEQAEHMRIEGFSRISSMMGETMMREQFFTADGRMLARAQRQRAAENPREPQVGTAGDKPRTPIEMDETDTAQLSSVTWFDVDPRTSDYTVTFIGPGQRTHIRHGIGNVSVAGTQMIFQAQRDYDADTLAPRPRNGPLVVKWESPDRFTVTMYRRTDPLARRAGDEGDDEAVGADGATRGTDGGAGDAVAIGSTRQADRRQPRLEDNVVYRAVHVRMTGDEEQETRDRISRILNASE